LLKNKSVGPYKSFHIEYDDARRASRSGHPLAQTVGDVREIDAWYLNGPDFTTAHVWETETGGVTRGTETRGIFGWAYKNGALVVSDFVKIYRLNLLGPKESPDETESEKIKIISKRIARTVDEAERSQILSSLRVVTEDDVQRWSEKTARYYDERLEVFCQNNE
jgi:hypothetical protein